MFGNELCYKNPKEIGEFGHIDASRIKLFAILRERPKRPTKADRNSLKTLLWLLANACKKF
jgi:hypothetical protein